MSPSDMCYMHVQLARLRTSTSASLSSEVSAQILNRSQGSRQSSRCRKGSSALQCSLRLSGVSEYKTYCSGTESRAVVHGVTVPGLALLGVRGGMTRRATGGGGRCCGTRRWRWEARRSAHRARAKRRRESRGAHVAASSALLPSTTLIGGKEASTSPRSHGRPCTAAQVVTAVRVTHSISSTPLFASARKRARGELLASHT
mmetsp:Transcript_104040/g.303733  ORF Transcript_104040/g.303733 Transcript_104040/m.303733 type:complete len:202 (+) Transcript_104040:352-957(+)